MIKNSRRNLFSKALIRGSTNEQEKRFKKSFADLSQFNSFVNYEIIIQYKNNFLKSKWKILFENTWQNKIQFSLSHFLKELMYNIYYTIKNYSFVQKSFVTTAVTDRYLKLCLESFNMNDHISGQNCQYWTEKATLNSRIIYPKY